jgi:hypothetical protein
MPAERMASLAPRSKAGYHGKNALQTENLTMPDDARYTEEPAHSEDKLLIAKVGVEGGGHSVYGKRCNGGWSFWTEGTSMDLDENDDEVWRSWSSDRVADLDLVLPRKWPLFYPWRSIRNSWPGSVRLTRRPDRRCRRR